MMETPKLFVMQCLLAVAFLGVTSVTAAVEFVGSSECTGCHVSQAKAWQGSHHDMAMRHAAEDSVKGNFNNVSIKSNNQTNRFFKKGAQYWVNIAGPDGKFKDYQIKYTFGFEPLQQYMVEFPDGRVQLIPFAWDSRKAEEGGQRWFNLYPDQTQKHQEFFWTNTGQNWNYMCADCHSTHVKKNFNVKDNTYNTTFSEINVGCEACHGPGSQHIAWTTRRDENILYAGFERTLTKSVERWVASSGQTTLRPASAPVQSQQTLVCAQCHSRHVQISTNDHIASSALGDRYLLTLIDSQRYYPDGQVYDEDYVYASFLQSKMHKNGVVCSNCHDPHSAKLSLPKETLCLQCHQAETYANKKHHHHPATSSGAQCVSCHMPTTTYMKIDNRHDHAWHIPRPDFAKSLGTPDTCLACHADKDSDWSGTAIQKWRAASNSLERDHGKDEKPFAPVFSAIDRGYAQATNALSHVAQNVVNAPIIRASALERMDQYIDTNTVIAIARGLKSDNEHIRVGAIRGAQGIQGTERWRLLSPLLADNVLAVRSEAASALIPLWQGLNKEQRQQLMPALNDYLEIQDFNADRGFSHTNKGNVFVQQGKYPEAEAAFNDSIRIDPHFANAYVNLADLYRLQQRESESIKILEVGELANPDTGNLPYSLGLAYIRTKDKTKAIEYFNKATLVEPENPQFHYVYGLSLEPKSTREAQAAIRKAYQLSANPQHLYALCEMQIKHQASQSQQCLAELRTVIPEEAVQALENLRIKN